MGSFPDWMIVKWRKLSSTTKEAIHMEIITVMVTDMGIITISLEYGYITQVSIF
jgi:hypothetical protein